MPAPKGKVETVPELKQGVKGTIPITIEQDKETLLSFIQTFKDKIDKSTNVIHPAFGKLTTEQWARLCYIHLDHHLKQFSA
jgi:hypothetical protein